MGNNSADIIENAMDTEYEENNEKGDEDEEVAVHGDLQPRAAVLEQSFLGVGEYRVGHDATTDEQESGGMELEGVEGVVGHGE